MRKTLCVSALMLALCCPAFAGEIPNPPAPTPPPPASPAQEPTYGVTFNGETPTPPDVSQSLTQIALELLAVLPSLL